MECSSWTSNGVTLARPILELDREKTSLKSVKSCVACCHCGGERCCILEVKTSIQLWGDCWERDGETKLTVSRDVEVISSKAHVPVANLVPFPIVFGVIEWLLIVSIALACWWEIA